MQVVATNLMLRIRYLGDQRNRVHAWKVVESSEVWPAAPATVCAMGHMHGEVQGACIGGVGSEVWPAAPARAGIPMEGLGEHIGREYCFAKMYLWNAINQGKAHINYT